MIASTTQQDDQAGNDRAGGGELVFLEDKRRCRVAIGDGATWVSTGANVAGTGEIDGGGVEWRDGRVGTVRGSAAGTDRMAVTASGVMWVSGGALGARDDRIDARRLGRFADRAPAVPSETSPPSEIDRPATRASARSRIACVQPGRSGRYVWARVAVSSSCLRTMSSGLRASNGTWPVRSR